MKLKPEMFGNCRVEHQEVVAKRRKRKPRKTKPPKAKKMAKKTKKMTKKTKTETMDGLAAGK